MNSITVSHNFSLKCYLFLNKNLIKTSTNSYGVSWLLKCNVNFNERNNFEKRFVHFAEQDSNMQITKMI